MSSGTPRSRPVARPASPRAARPESAPSAKPASASADKKEKKPKAKKPKAPPKAPGEGGLAKVDVPISNVQELTEDQARQQLSELQKKYGALIVNFNNQQVELTAAQRQIARLEEAQKQRPPAAAGPAEGGSGDLSEQLNSTLAELRAAEAQNMQLQKRINKLQVEHVSEEEVDQLFYALELKEQQLAQAQRDKAGLEQEVMTARQLTARGTNYEPKFIEIHHHNNLSDDDDSDDDDDDDK